MAMAMARTRAALLAARRAGRRSVHCSAVLQGPQAVRTALASVQQRLARKTDGDAQAAARTDAKALLAASLRPPLAHSNDVVLHLDRELTLEEEAALDSVVERRSRGEPLAYVLGRKEFWSLDLLVTSDTLIPRADSEVLIETLMSLYPKHAGLSILDVGTGSGCLLLAALIEFPNATGVGVDISPGALGIASENARRHGLDGRSTFLHRDLAGLAQGEPLVDGDRSLDKSFDVVMSNPPYIPRRELGLVAADVLAFEPHVALFSDPEGVREQLKAGDHDGGQDDAGDDGLRMYRLLHQSLPSLLKPGASGSVGIYKPSVIVEVGSKAQAYQVRDIFTSDAVDPAMEFGTAKPLLDGQSRHRGVLFQAM